MLKTKQIIFGIFGISVLLSAVFVTMLLIGRRQSITTSAGPDTVLSLRSEQSPVEVNNSFNISVDISSGTNSVIGAELNINFDPNYVEVLDIVPGSFLTDPQTRGKTINNTSGSLTYTIYLDPDGTPQSGDSVLAVISARAKAITGSSVISFNPSTLVVANTPDVGINVVKSMVNLDLIISDIPTL